MYIYFEFGELISKKETNIILATISQRSFAVIAWKSGSKNS